MVWLSRVLGEGTFEWFMAPFWFEFIYNWFGVLVLWSN
jgi:hypothetical protein